MQFQVGFTQLSKASTNFFALPYKRKIYLSRTSSPHVYIFLWVCTYIFIFLKSLEWRGWGEVLELRGREEGRVKWKRWCEKGKSTKYWNLLIKKKLLLNETILIKSKNISKLNKVDKNLFQSCTDFANLGRQNVLN